MKVDKEFLIKHVFWILAAAAVILAATDLSYLKFSVGGGIDATKKQIKDKLTKLQSEAKKEVKGPQWIDVAKQRADILTGQQNEVWKLAAASQANLMTFPEAFEEKYHYQDGLFAIAIKAERNKAEPKAADPKVADPKAADQPKKSEEETAGGTYEGVVTDWNQDHVVVAGKGGQTKTFQRTVKIKITVTDDKGKTDPGLWNSVKLKDWVTVTYEKGRYFGDEMTKTEKDRFASTYLDQIKGILQLVNPYTTKGDGVVQLKGWMYDEKEPLPSRGNSPFLVYVAPRDDGLADTGPWITQKNPAEFYKEVWTAQEDLWIQRELYRLIALANSYVSNFKGSGGAGKDKQFAFTNPYWEIKLTLTKNNTLEGKLKNVSARRQRLDIKFKVKVRKTGQPEELFVEGEPVDPEQSITLKPHKVKANPPATGIYGVEQVLTWETAAVKRIDQVSLGKGVGGAAPAAAFVRGRPGPRPTPGVPAQASGAETSQSHFTYNKPLKAFTFPTDKKEGDAPPPVDPNAAPPGTPPGGAAAVDTISPNGFVFERYLETDKARRVPVGLVLIVDQQHVARVQAAFADSALRFLTTQVILNRYPNPLRPADAPTAVAGASGGLPPGPGRFPQPYFPPGGPRGGPQQSPGSSAGGGDESESNMELVLYGIVSLYERFPPRTMTTPTP